MVVNNSVKQLNANKRKIYSQSEISYSTSTCPFSLFNTQSNIFQCSIINQPPHRIGPCKLILTEPSIFDRNEIVSRYCIKCTAFIAKRFLNCRTLSSNIEYNCPKCFSIAYITFYFMHENNKSRTIKVYCYDKELKVL